MSLHFRYSAIQRTHENSESARDGQLESQIQHVVVISRNVYRNLRFRLNIRF